MYDKNGSRHEPKGTSDGGKFGSSNATEAEQKRMEERGYSK